MRNLLTAILCIALTIALLGCDKKKAKDETKKAFDEVVTEEDGKRTSTKGSTQSKTKTIKPTKSALSAYRVRKETPIKFTKVAGYTYALKSVISGVSLGDVVGDSTKKQVSSTKVISGVVVVARRTAGILIANLSTFFYM